MGRKVSLVGAGNIGGTLAYLLGARGVARELVMVDVDCDMSKGKALDLSQAFAVNGVDVTIAGSSDYAAIKGSDVIVVTAGVSRKEGMSRDDLLDINAGLIKDIAVSIGKYAPDAFVIVVTNPLDSMVWCMYKHSGLPSSKVVGMAGILDSARFSYFLAEHLNVSLSSVSSLVLGGHGDLMLPLVRYSTIGGVPLTDLIEMGVIEQKTIDEIIERTRRGGEEIVKLLKIASAYYAPATSSLSIVESYICNKKRVLPCAAYLSGEYGVRDLFVGVPVIIGSGGVEKVLELKLTEQEDEVFRKSVELIENSVQVLRESQGLS